MRIYRAHLAVLVSGCTVGSGGLQQVCARGVTVTQGSMRHVVHSNFHLARSHRRCSIYRVADWFAQLNHKMGGDLKKIRVVGEYMIEVRP